MLAQADAPWRRALDAVSGWLPPALVAAGVLWAALSLLDPPHALGSLAGPGLAAGGLVLQRVLALPMRRLVVVASFALAYGLGALSRPELQRADFSGYYVWLRSAAFDRDLDFANESTAWGYPELPLTPTGRRPNRYTVGPALLWSPFFVLAHGYVKVDGVLEGRYEADGYSAPYLRSAALGTITAAMAGAWLLGSVLAARVGPAAAALAVVGAVATSPVVFYVFVQPGMAHGATFALAAVLVWAAERVRAAPSRRRWIALGALLGGAALMRPQAAVLVVIPAALAVWQLRSGRARPRWVAYAAAVAVAMLLPQLVAWKIVYGSFSVPAGPGLWAPGGAWVAPSSPRLFEVLLAADHGLFTWTPAVIVAVLGLLVALRRWPTLGAAGLLVFLATAWVSGSVAGWGGSDAFGAQRFDVAVPFFAVGFAAVLDACRRVPLLAPALVLGAMALWNVGLVKLLRSRAVVETASLEDVAARQARQLRSLAESALGRVAGPAGRALAYRFFVGEFFYRNLNPAGTIDLAGGDPRYLASGWSVAENTQGPATFRWALRPQACVRFPLERVEQDLRAAITARAPAALEAQTMTITLNGSPLKQATLQPEWADVPVTLPTDVLVPGENLLCLRFSQALPEAEGSRAAAVARIQLP